MWNNILAALCGAFLARPCKFEVLSEKAKVLLEKSILLVQVYLTFLGIKLLQVQLLPNERMS